MTNPELSVVVPAFNEAEGLAAFLEQLFGVLHGCCADFEVWIIDDGSRDATWQQARNEQEKYPQLRGVQFTAQGATTHSIVMRSLTRSIRIIETRHSAQRGTAFAHYKEA